MASAGVSLSGLRELRGNFSQIENLFEYELSNALEAGGLIIEGEAKRKCVVDTGRLRASITTTTNTPQKTELSVSIGTNVEYASHIEYGTGTFSEDGKGRDTPWKWKGTGKYKGWHTTRGMPAKPFLRPALYSRQNEALDVINDRIGDFLKRRK